MMFYERSDKTGLRSQCKVCMRLVQRTKKISVRFPVKWPPTTLSWLTPITPYDPEKERSKMERPSRKYGVRTVIVDPESTAADDARSND